MVLLYLLFFQKMGTIQEGKVKWIFSVYGLNHPYYANADSKGNMYVSDTDSHRILVFDTNGQFVKQIGRNKSKKQLNAPYGTYIDEKKSRIYVCDWTAQSVTVFSTKNGKLLFKFPDDPSGSIYGGRFTPYQIDMYKNKLYVTNHDGVVVFSMKGKFERKIGSLGSGVGQFNFPNGITIDKKTGNIYVADVLNRRVVALKNNGSVRWIVGRPDTQVSSKESKKYKVAKLISFFQLPRSVEFGTDGNLYVVDTFSYQIVVISPDGKLISSVGQRGVEDGKFNFPEGLNMRDDGVIYIADRANNRAQAIKIIGFPKPKKDKQELFKSQFHLYEK
jgi:DNA-binding beta-propeller fold protein YncE